MPKSPIHFITYKGETGLISKICEMARVNPGSVKARHYSKGVTMQEAFDWIVAKGKLLPKKTIHPPCAPGPEPLVIRDGNRWHKMPVAPYKPYDMSDFLLIRKNKDGCS
jgi:hypothetical protein